MLKELIFTQKEVNKTFKNSTYTFEKANYLIFVNGLDNKFSQGTHFYTREAKKN